MDRLATQPGDQLWHYEPWVRDPWVQAEAAKLKPGSWVLDAGAGACKYRPYFSHCRYETQDFCQYNGPLVRYGNGITYVCDITAIPLPDGCLDAILCTEVFEHVTDPIAVVKEFSRLLKPGGKLWLTSPLLSYLHMEPYHFYGGFTHYWYEHWLPKHGITVDSVVPVGGPGRTAVVQMCAFYQAWGEAEKRLSGPRWFASRLGRGAAKIPIQWLLPRLLPKFDRWLGGNLVCSGYLITATREMLNASLAVR
jgi:SAM-dependent methyltransferase